MSLGEPNHIAKLASLFNIFLKGIIELPINFPDTRFYSSNKAAATIRTELINDYHQSKNSETGKRKGIIFTRPIITFAAYFIGRCFSEKEIANNILLLLFAGHDTSTVSITLLIKSLSEHPDVYDKVLKEQLEISKAKEVGEYSRNVVSEVMRRNPPVTRAYREAPVDIEYAGYTMPKVLASDSYPPSSSLITLNIMKLMKVERCIESSEVLHYIRYSGNF
ncbi:beta-amyrin 28-monooxygenase-like [Bidens hawaiensis]|uniref:beta-amyrin 28-monooxygenase-like n=1 Tax=Bidens hawaiensis TaxID=980011 RepID=UPI004049325F